MVPSSSCANLHFSLSRSVHVGVCVCNSACRLQRLSLLVCPLLPGHTCKLLSNHSPVCNLMITQRLLKVEQFPEEIAGVLHLLWQWEHMRRSMGGVFDSVRNSALSLGLNDSLLCRYSLATCRGSLCGRNSPDVTRLLHSERRHQTIDFFVSSINLLNFYSCI